MHDFPHQYSMQADGFSDNRLIVHSGDLSSLDVAPPIQFDGPGHLWSPEDFFMASLSSCLVLTFRAIARSAKFEWTSLECESKGTLDRVEKKLQFTEVTSFVKLTLPENADTTIAETKKEKALLLLQKTEENCLILNSLNINASIAADIVFGSE